MNKADIQYLLTEDRAPDAGDWPRLNIVSMLVPVRCGLYQSHCNLARTLTKRGSSIGWLCSGSVNANLIVTEDAEESPGELLAPHTADLAERYRIVLARINAISPDVVIFHALGDPTILNCVRYLPTSIPRILIIHSTSLATYRAARAVRDHVDAAVAISPRIEQDLITTYRFSRDKVNLIPHGIDLEAFSCRTLKDRSAGPLMILSHGRIAKDKGVFLIPEILTQFGQSSSDWECTISGDGPDLQELKRRLAVLGLSRRVHFTGWTAASDVPELMCRHDVLLFPSEHEGFGTVLIEAMAGGCVPISSRLPGVTDWIIQDGVNGLLFPVGKAAQATQHLLGLLCDRSRLADLQKRASLTSRKYSLEGIAEQYHRLLSKVLSQPRQLRPAEQLDRCELAPGLRPAWWYRLPNPMKDSLRLIRERVRSFVRIP